MIGHGTQPVPLAQLGKTKTYDVIVCDPPFKYKRTAGVGVADNHYSTMDVAQLAALQVQCISAEDSIILMWASGPTLSKALELMRAWGFRYSTVFTNWIKTGKNSEGTTDASKAAPIGLGSWSYPSCELLLAGTRGSPLKKLRRNRVDQVLMAPRRTHSEKPGEVWDRINQFFISDARIIELFARIPATGEPHPHEHDVWGAESAQRAPAQGPVQGPAPPLEGGASARCTTCGLGKRLRDFHKNSSRPSGHCGTCKECTRATYLKRTTAIKKRAGNNEHKTCTECGVSKLLDTFFTFQKICKLCYTRRTRRNKHKRSTSAI